jgi:hypothetical protein
MKARRQIIAEALVAGNRFISYSRRRAFYTETQRYYRPTYSYRSIIPPVDQLAAAGLIEHEKVPPGHRGFQSRFRATSDLLSVLSPVELQYKPLELIVLRDAAGNPIDYRDNRETRAMRKRLAELNEALLSQQIGLGDQIICEGDRLDNGGRAQTQLHRVFHRGDFANGSRFYGGHWQNIPAKGGRDRIFINGEPTTEVDYRGLHIRLLYQEAGKPMPADPYDIDGLPRKQAKLALLIAINARGHTSAVRALADALRGDAAAHLLPPTGCLGQSRPNIPISPGRWLQMPAYDSCGGIANLPSASCSKPCAQSGSSRSPCTTVSSSQPTRSKD